MKLKIHSKVAETATVIPNIFFDTYMPKANGEFLKVYLYLYRWHTDSTKEISIASVADTLDLTEGDVIRALKYWQAEGLLALMTDKTNTTVEEIIMLPLSSRPAADTAHPSGMMKSSAAIESAKPSDTLLSAWAAKAAAAKAPDFSKPSYTMNEIKNFSVENDGDKLFFVIGQYLGRPLSQTDTNTIVFFHERLGFSIDLIEYLFEYCVSNNHRSIHYIEKVAISWAEKGIKTVSAAKAQSTAYNKTNYAVLKAFGITGRAPTEGEIAFIKRWHEDYCFPMPLILEACRRTMLATHNPSFEYTDKILKNWKTKHVTNMEDVAALDLAYEASKKAAGQKSDGQKSATQKTYGQKTAGQNDTLKEDGVRRYGSRFGNFDQRVYNYNDLEQKLAKKLQKH